MKIHFGLTVVFIAIIAGIMIYYYNKPVKSLENQSVDFILDAASLFLEFEENESEANRKYLDKVIELRGTIVNIDAGKIHLRGSTMFGVICEMEDPLQTKNYQDGDLITCKGICTGKLMDVVLTRCIIVNE